MAERQFDPIAILGSGSWGTALALSLARRGQIVRLWSIDETEVRDMLSDRANNRYLPGFAFPVEIEPQYDIAETVRDINDILVVVPSIGFRNTLSLAKAHLKDTARIVSATKGIDETSGELLNEVALQTLGKQHPFAVLSGPSFAREVAASLPTAVNIASEDQTLARHLKARFESPIFRVQLSDDIIGVELGGVVKNVIAIATGIGDGMELGSDFRSALITFGLAEITRLGLKLGAKAETFVGLAGLGDLILTCSDNQSRNRRLGLAIGKGESVQEATKQIGQVVEGKRNAELILQLAHQHQVKMPICTAVLAILQEQIAAKLAFDNLFIELTK